MPTPIYHITHIRNLESILRSRGLIATSRLQQQQIDYQDIAHRSIQDRRAIIQVPCAAGGFLHDYIPCYFAPRSPMLYTINKGNVEGYTEGQKPVIYLVSEAEIIAAHLLFAFTDGHAVIGYTDFYDDLQALDVIDWEIMQEKYWNNTLDDSDRKRRRQAEFLIHEFCPWTLITEIGVINNTMGFQVQEILQNFNDQTRPQLRFTLVGTTNAIQFCLSSIK
jgi:ssDNA thymidine ADP-ribosyltransferase, DarT